MTQHPLDQLTIASPCTANWDEMEGDERSRFCNQCQLNVYNLAGMPRKEAEKLLEDKEGRLCVRYYRREDGTVMTKDCPIGLRALRFKMVKLAGLTAATVLGLVTMVFGGQAVAEDKTMPCPTGPQYLTGSPAPYPLMGSIVEMGDVAGPRPIMGEAVAIPQPPQDPPQGEIEPPPPEENNPQQ